MKKTVRAGMVAAATFAALATSVSTASAAPSGGGGGGGAKVANPAQACAAIPATLAQFGIEAEGFTYSSCVRTVAGRVPNLPFGNPYEQCAALEEGQEGFAITYPYTFYADGEAPFPALRANNREQCARALWTFHTIGSYLEGPA
jgi:hypothetical protein